MLLASASDFTQQPTGQQPVAAARHAAAFSCGGHPTLASAFCRGANSAVMISGDISITPVVASWQEPRDCFRVGRGARRRYSNATH